ncbi:MAG: transcriptional regulator [Putridiphycobacter sp.]|nr:transcriptional regulator [Putridiphycobacter sp.]
MPKLNPLLHQELRLSIISFLATIDSADFNKLMAVTKASKGNLSVQISKLKAAGYVNVKKTFKNNYPHTSCAITKKGQLALSEYVENLKQLLNI